MKCQVWAAIVQLVHSVTVKVSDDLFLALDIAIAESELSRSNWLREAISDKIFGNTRTSGNTEKGNTETGNTPAYGKMGNTASETPPVVTRSNKRLIDTSGFKTQHLRSCQCLMCK